mmetsp:Transcript_25215/g.58436  ORF Transcript_25215/g.58436 Transcript_25215/m.58436 type:complete len:236 (-) Transcript_25215:519-1226(-)
MRGRGPRGWPWNRTRCAGWAWRCHKLRSTVLSRGNTGHFRGSCLCTGDRHSLYFPLMDVLRDRLHGQGTWARAGSCRGAFACQLGGATLLLRAFGLTWIARRSWRRKRGLRKLLQLRFVWLHGILWQVQRLQSGLDRRLPVRVIRQLESQLHLKEVQMLRLLALEDEGHHPADRTKTGSATTAMQVGLLLRRQIQIHNHVYLVCINASSHQVGAHEHAVLKSLKSSESLRPPGLV